MTYVYIAADERGRALYVGIAESWAQRWVQHVGSPFYPLVRGLELRYFTDRKEAETHERALIETLRPRYNIVYLQAAAKVKRRGPARVPVRPTPKPKALPADRTRLLMTADEVARALSIPKTSVYALAKSGRIPRTMVGKRTFRFHVDAVAAYVRSLPPPSVSGA